MKVINILKIKLKNSLKRNGYILIKESEYNNNIDYYRKILLLDKIGKKEEKIDSIVFSKDRAMQLHAFLKSYLEKVDSKGTMYVLYKTSDERHAKSYQQLKQIFIHDDIKFIQETSFSNQLIEICETSTALTIGLFVDDMIFIQKVDYRQILNFNSLAHVVTLGRGRELDYSVVLEKKQQLPEFKEVKGGYLLHRWDYIDEHNDWTFPVGVGGYFYGSNELVVMLKGINFKAPNTLEINLQRYKQFFIHRFGVCMNTVCCVGVHANMVQSEFPNPDIGTFSILELLNKWEEGLMIDITKFYGMSGDKAQFQSFDFLKR